MTLTIAVDLRMQGLDNLAKAAGPAADVAFARALNHTGAVVRTRYLREVRKTLGIVKHPLARQSAVNAVKKRTSVRRATPGNLEYSLAGFGRGLNLIYYSPKETPAGLSVNWLGARRVVPHAFLHGGRFPRRHGGFAVKQGVSMERTGRGRRSLKPPFGPGVAEAMVQPKPASIWETEARARLEPRLAHELTAILLGHVGAGRK